MEVPQIDQPHFKRALTRAIVFPLIALLLFVSVLLWQLEDMLAVAGLVDHSDEAIAQAHVTQSLLVDMETGLRGYLITGERDFLEPYLQAQPLIQPAFANLAVLVADNPDQSGLLSQLTPNYIAWQEYASSVIQLRDAGGDYASLVRSRAGKQRMDAMRAQIDRFVDAEMTLRDQRSRTSQRITQIVIGSSIALALTVGGALAFFSWRQMLMLSQSYSRIVALVHERAQLLDEQREHLQITLASIGDGVIVTDAQGSVTMINLAGQELTGWDQVDAQGQPLTAVFAIVNEETRQQVENPVARVLENGVVVGLANHTLLIRPDGTEIPIDDSAAPIRDQHGQLIGVVLVFRDISEQKKAAEVEGQLAREVEAQRERLKNVIANVPGLVWEAWGQPDAANQQIDFVSEYVVTMLGYSIEDWISTPNFWLKIVHPDDQAHAAEVANATFRSGRAGINQFRWVRRDGQVIWVESFSAPIVNASGQPIGMRGVTLDITDRKRAETALRESEERFRSLFDKAPLGICLGRDGKILYGNNALAHMFGYDDISALQGVPLIDLVAPEARAEIDERIRRREAGEPALSSYETTGLRRNGSRFPYSVEVTRIMLPDGPASVAFCLDVTGRKRDEEHQRLLMETSELLSGSLEYEPTLEHLTQVIVPRFADWVAIHMLEDDVVRRLAVRHIDPARTELARNRPERYPLQPGGQHIVAHVLASGKSEFYAHVPDDLLIAAARDQQHLHLLRALGFTSYICVPLIARGRTLGAMTLVTSDSGRVYDSTDLLLAEDLAARAAIAIDNARLYRLAQEAVHARDQFLSIASHELKTPLTSLIGYTDLILRRSGRDTSLAERDQRAIRIISEQAGRLNKLVAALLDLSRIETGQLSIDRGIVELNQLAQRLVHEVAHAQSQEAERIVFQPAPEPLVLIGDELRLEQVIQNLLQNAIKYSPAGGTVAIQIERRGDQACLIVRDEGIGIPASALPNLFRRFYRAPNVDAHRISGMGVGLFVVKEIVHLHGGEISVESQENIGSTFTVCLPLRPEDQPAATEQQANEVAS
jgi:PAS domain S-box-containing protein